MRVLDLFSGIGGFSAGFSWASSEFETVAFCEIDTYAWRVLKKHWPDVPIYNDICKIGEKELARIGKIDLISAGFPCQDISVAGKQKGLKDEEGNQTRSGLFFEIIRLATICKPRWIVLENVAALLSNPEWMGAVLGSLSEIGYNADWEIISAKDMGAPHLRKRVWIVAYPSSTGGTRGADNEADRGEALADTECKRQLVFGNEKGNSDRVNEKGEPGRKRTTCCGSDFTGGWWTVEPDLGLLAHELSPGLDLAGLEDQFFRVATGVPERVNQLKCLGNAIVPQIAELIGRRIIEIEKGMK